MYEIEKSKSTVVHSNLKDARPRHPSDGPSLLWEMLKVHGRSRRIFYATGAPHGLGCPQSIFSCLSLRNIPLITSHNSYGELEKASCSEPRTPLDLTCVTFTIILLLGLKSEVVVVEALIVRSISASEFTTTRYFQSGPKTLHSYIILVVFSTDK
ncbi:hypothetical protein VTO42DRAFT_2541 [Malbranchea cinnamomea]